MRVNQLMTILYHLQLIDSQPLRRDLDERTVLDNNIEYNRFVECPHPNKEMNRRSTAWKEYLIYSHKTNR